MKTRTQLEAMTKQELDEHAKETHGVDLDRRRKKAALVDEILSLQQGQGPAPSEAPKPEGKVRITVTRYPSSSGVPLNVNGKRFHLPIGKRVTVPEWVLPSLEAVAGLEFTKE